MKFYKLYSALADLYDMHGISLNNDDFETYAYKALEYIGNYYGETISVDLNIKDYKIELPEDCDYIEQITTKTEDFRSTDNIYRENYNNQIIENYIEARKGTQTPMIYQAGSFIDFEYISDNIIKFKVTDYPIKLMYRKRMADEKGLPMVTAKEIDAISAFCIYKYNYKKLNATKDKSIMELLPLYQNEWRRKCDNARTPEMLNQNDMDALANVLHSWDRKQYNVTNKLIR